MKQLLQNLGTGEFSLADVVAAGSQTGRFLLRSRYSLVSAGTERMLVEFGRAGWIGKVRQQPEKFKSALEKVRVDGLGGTLQAVRAKLEMPMPLGYCNVGEILDAGGNSEVRVGQRVVSNSHHAEIVSAPVNLSAIVPDGVTDEVAAFTPLAAIAWEGIELLQVQSGEKVVVVGLGLIGQLAVRILKGLGCDVLGIDPDGDRRVLAERFGAAVVPKDSDPVDVALAWTKGQGVAGVLISASSSSHAIVSQAARSCRYRGRIVLVGVVGLQLNRADFYRNEVSFQVSCSYGRRDHTGPGSVRANFRRVLDAMSAGQLPVGDLITHRFPFASAPAAYDVLRTGSPLGILLDYRSPETPGELNQLLAREVNLRPEVSDESALRIALLGAGNFAIRTLLPALQRRGSSPYAVVSHQGAAAIFAARKFGAAWAGTDETRVWDDPRLGAVILTTRHESHAAQAATALLAGKHVWVEKPLAISMDGLRDVRKIIAAEAIWKSTLRPVLTVGFNRRFAPIATRLRELLTQRTGPIEVHMRINAGRLDADHWTLNRKIGGGRIVGEGCHFIDLARYFAGSPIASARCVHRDESGQDGGTFELRFSNGSQATIDYRTDLPSHIPKELIEVKGEGFSAVIDNWARLRSSGLGGLWQGGFWSRAPRKGHDEALAAFLVAIRGGPTPIPMEEIFEVSSWAIRLQAMVEGETVTSLEMETFLSENAT